MCKTRQSESRKSEIDDHVLRILLAMSNFLYTVHMLSASPTSACDGIIGDVFITLSADGSRGRLFYECTYRIPEKIL